MSKYDDDLCQIVLSDAGLTVKDAFVVSLSRWLVESCDVHQIVFIHSPVKDEQLQTETHPLKLLHDNQCMQVCSAVNGFTCLFSRFRLESTWGEETSLTTSTQWTQLVSLSSKTVNQQSRDGRNMKAQTLL